MAGIRARERGGLLVVGDRSFRATAEILARICGVCGAAATSTSDRRCRYCGAELPW